MQVLKLDQVEVDGSLKEKQMFQNYWIIGFLQKKIVRD